MYDDGLLKLDHHYTFPCFWDGIAPMARAHKVYKLGEDELNRPLVVALIICKKSFI